MENNIQRFKGNDNTINYMNQNPSLPYGNVPSTNEYSNQDNPYLYNSSSGMPFQNYQVNYRPEIDNYDPHSYYNNYSYDPSVGNNYVYSVPPNVQNFPDIPSINSHDLNDIVNLNESSYQFQNSYDPKQVSPHAHMYHQNMTNSFRNFSPNSVRYGDPSTNNNYYQDLMYLQNYNDNIYGGYNAGQHIQNTMDVHTKTRPANGLPNPNIQHHPRSVNFHQSSIRSQSYQKIEPVVTSISATDTLKSAVLSVAKMNPKPSITTPTPTPTLNHLTKSMSDFKIDSSAFFKSSSFQPQSHKTTSVISNNDYQINPKDFPALCDTFKIGVSPSIPRIMPSVSQSKVANCTLDDTPVGKRISNSVNTNNNNTIPIIPITKPPVIIPDVTKFLSDYEEMVEKSDVLNTYGVNELFNNKNRTLMIGCDLSEYGINIAAADNIMLHKSLISPFEICGKRSIDLDYPVPHEYLIYPSIREHISTFNCHNFIEDLLFHLYYTEDDDKLKLSSISNLYSRKWKYHKNSKIWIRLPSNYSSGDSYLYFDPIRWETITTDVPIDSKFLEDSNNNNNSYLEYEVPIVLAQKSLLSTFSSSSSSLMGGGGGDSNGRGNGYENSITMNLATKIDPVKTSKSVNLINDTASP